MKIGELFESLTDYLSLSNDWEKLLTINSMLVAIQRNEYSILDGTPVGISVLEISSIDRIEQLIKMVFRKNQKNIQNLATRYENSGVDVESFKQHLLNLYTSLKQMYKVDLAAA